MALVGAVCFPIALFWFGWCVLPAHTPGTLPRVLTDSSAPLQDVLRAHLVLVAAVRARPPRLLDPVPVPVPLQVGPSTLCRSLPSPCALRLTDSLCSSRAAATSSTSCVSRPLLFTRRPPHRADLLPPWQYLFAAASALAGNTVCRSLFGTGMPMFATQMFEVRRWMCPCCSPGVDPLTGSLARTPLLLNADAQSADRVHRSGRHLHRLRPSPLLKTTHLSGRRLTRLLLFPADLRRRPSRSCSSSTGTSSGPARATRPTPKRSRGPLHGGLSRLVPPPIHLPLLPGLSKRLLPSSPPPSPIPHTSHLRTCDCGDSYAVSLIYAPAHAVCLIYVPARLRPCPESRAKEWLSGRSRPSAVPIRSSPPLSLILP